MKNTKTTLTIHQPTYGAERGSGRRRVDCSADVEDFDLHDETCGLPMHLTGRAVEFGARSWHFTLTAGPYHRKDALNSYYTLLDWDTLEDMTPAKVAQHIRRRLRDCRDSDLTLRHNTLSGVDS